MVEASLCIQNRLGLHARAAAKLVQTASRFNAEVTLSRDGRNVNAKSIMGVMMLAASMGVEIKVRAEGKDEVSALQAIRTLIDDKFDEEA